LRVLVSSAGGKYAVHMLTPRPERLPRHLAASLRDAHHRRAGRAGEDLPELRQVREGTDDAALTRAQVALGNEENGWSAYLAIDAVLM
jgi:hypothetical protein